MDLDLLTYAYHYDKEKNRSLNHNYFEVMAEVSYRNPRMCSVLKEYGDWDSGPGEADDL